MNNKAQLDYPIITFFIIVFMLLFMAPIMLKLFTSIRNPMSASLGNISEGGAIGQTNFNKVIDAGINLWDKVIVFCFVIAIMLLFVSAFFIDANPFFIIIYIFISFMLILFAPNIVEALDNIYDSALFSTENALLPFVVTIKDHFAAFLVGVMVITGIIIYGKIAFLGGNRYVGR